MNLGCCLACFTADVPATVLLPVNDHHAATATLVIPLLATPATVPVAPTFFKWAIRERTLRSGLWWGWPRYSIPKNPDTSPPLFTRPPRWRRSIRAVKGSGDDVLASERISCFRAHDLIVLRCGKISRRWALRRDGIGISKPGRYHKVPFAVWTPVTNARVVRQNGQPLSYEFGYPPN